MLRQLISSCCFKSNFHSQLVATSFFCNQHLYGGGWGHEFVFLQRKTNINLSQWEMKLRRFPPNSRQLLLLSFQLSNLTLPIGLQEFVDESSHIKWCPTFFRSRWKRILQFNWWLSTLPKGWRGRDGFVRAHLWDRPIGSLSEGVGEWKRTHDLWFLKTIGEHTYQYQPCLQRGYSGYVATSCCI